jgi:sorting nexin-13
MKYEKKPDRDEETRNRTRVAAKIALLSCLSGKMSPKLGAR